MICSGVDSRAVPLTVAGSWEAILPLASRGATLNELVTRGFSLDR